MSVPEGIIENIIVFICLKKYGVFSTELIKLLYLIDLDYYREQGEKLTGLNYKNYYYGPYSPDIELCLEKLYNKRILSPEIIITWTGRKGNFIKPNVKENAIELSQETKGFIEKAIKRYGRMRFSDLVTYSKSTIPYLHSDFNEDIDFENDDLIELIAKKENKETSEIATEIICNDEKLISLFNEAEAEIKGLNIVSSFKDKNF